MWFCHKWCYNIVSSDQSVFFKREVDLWEYVFDSYIVVNSFILECAA